MMVNRDVIDKIEEMALEAKKPEVMEIKERTYTTKEVKPLLPPAPDYMQIHTLTGLVDYIKANVDSLNFSNLVVHVKSAKHVTLCSGLDKEWLQRFGYVWALYEPPNLGLGQFKGLDRFIIDLQTLFVQTETIASLLKVVGNLSDGAVKTVTDDGVSQQVSIKAGVTRVEEVSVPNPVMLQPYRTFPEIEQPESPFIFRLKSITESGEDLPGGALFDADADLWQMEAIKRIADYLREKISEIPIIA